MSAAPRPRSQLPARSGLKGSRCHWLRGSELTTSMWPLRMSDRPWSAAGCQVATTFRFALTSQSNGEWPGMCPDRIGIHRDVHGGETHLEQSLSNDPLARLLVVEHGGSLDEAREDLRHPLRLCGDRAEDLLVLGGQRAGPPRRG
jgi:hypothetical protein